MPAAGFSLGGIGFNNNNKIMICDTMAASYTNIESIWLQPLDYTPMLSLHDFILTEDQGFEVLQ